MSAAFLLPGSLYSWDVEPRDGVARDLGDPFGFFPALIVEGTLPGQ